MTFLRMLVVKGVLVQVVSRFKILMNADDVIFRTAFDGQVDLIVTGDKHLLGLGEFKGIKIKSVSEALDQIRQEKSI